MQRTAVWWFGLLLLATLPAFWPSYFAAPAFKADFLHVHFHGLVMFGWMALLLAQAALIRGGRRPLHRALGKLSFVMVPLVVVSTVLLGHYRLRQGPPNAELLYFFAVQWGLLVAFLFSYGMAMWHRKAPLLHMRYMAGTALAVVDPILARILAGYLGVGWPLMQVITYAFVLGVLAFLWWRERPAPHARAWSAMLVVFTFALMPTFVVPQLDAWRALTEAFARLPLP